MYENPENNSAFVKEFKRVVKEMPVDQIRSHFIPGMGSDNSEMQKQIEDLTIIVGELLNRFNLTFGDHVLINGNMIDVRSIVDKNTCPVCGHQKK